MSTSQRRFGFGLPFLALSAVLLLGRPASAGHYELSSTGSGTLTINGSSTSLSNPSVYNTDWLGHLSFSYSETINYTWAPDDGYTIEDDPPVASVVTINGSATFAFTPYMGAYSGSGTATGSATIGPNTVNATTTAGPNGMGGILVNPDGSGTYSLPDDDHEISGASGSFTETYSGAADADGWHILVTQVGFSRTINVQKKYIWIINAVGVKSGSANQSTATVTGGYTAPGGPVRGRISLSSNTPGSTGDFTITMNGWQHNFTGVPDTVSHNNAVARVRLQRETAPNTYADFLSPTYKESLYRDTKAVSGYSP